MPVASQPREVIAGRRSWRTTNTGVRPQGKSGQGSALESAFLVVRQGLGFPEEGDARIQDRKEKMQLTLKCIKNKMDEWRIDGYIG